MRDEILDEAEIIKTDHRKPITRLIQISIGTLILYFLIEQIKNYIQKNLFEWRDLQIKSMGLILIGIVIANSILLPTHLSKIKPDLTKIKVVVYTGLILFAIEIVFKILQSLYLFQNQFTSYYWQIFKAATIISGVGMLIANIKIHKIRGDNLNIPVLLLIVGWIIFGLLLGE